MTENTSNAAKEAKTTDAKDQKSAPKGLNIAQQIALDLVQTALKTGSFQPPTPKYADTNVATAAKHGMYLATLYKETLKQLIAK